MIFVSTGGSEKVLIERARPRPQLLMDVEELAARSESKGLLESWLLRVV